jgi:pilus assembly protein Flp/PilA
MKKLINFFKDEEGATAVEYGVMVALIAGAIVVTVTALGVSLNNLFSGIGGVIDANTPAAS